MLLLVACVKPPGPVVYDDIRGKKGNVLVLNEGLFQWNQAELTLYNKWDKSVSQNCFYNYNKRKAGDVLQSLTPHRQLLYLVMNNSGVIEILTQDALQSVFSWKGFRSPRYMIFHNDTKAYVSDLYAGGVYIVNPDLKQIEGLIKVSSWTEHMLIQGTYVYVSAPRSDKLYRIDIDQNKVTDSLTTLTGGNSLVLDRSGYIWQACMGDSVKGMAGGLVCVDPKTFQVISKWTTTGSVSALCVNADRNRLFFLNKDVFVAEVAQLNPRRIFSAAGRQLYGLGYDPELDELYVANAKDFVSSGMSYRLKATDGKVVDSFATGIIPNGFYFLP